MGMVVSSKIEIVFFFAISHWPDDNIDDSSIAYSQWPKYPTKATNFVFRLPRNESYIEDDTYRAAGTDVINNIAR
jgi:hypothetical protein